MTKTEEKDSIEKVSEDIRNATTLLASFHERLVALYDSSLDDTLVFHEMRNAITSLMEVRECLAAKKEEK